jgi:hypothetical protein
VFLPSWYKFYRALRVSRYKFDRSQKIVTMQDLYCGQVRVSRFKMLNEFIWPADSHDDKRSKRKKEFGSINYMQFLFGWPSRSPGKKCDKQLTHIVRVRCMAFFYEFKIYNLVVPKQLPDLYIDDTSLK